MGRMQTFGKYVLWIIGFALFTMFCTYVGLNATYKNIINRTDLPENVNINMAQATKVNGRIYGEVTSTDENNLEGKYIKIDIYTRNLAKLGTKYIKIENTKINEQKKFVAFFTADKISNYNIEIVDDTEEVRKEIELVKELYKDVFTDEELKAITIIGLILGLAYVI